MYNKLFTKILDSSIWLEPTATRIVWLTFLAAMDQDGFAQFASIANVAHRAIVTLQEAEEAIRCLENEDLNSSNTKNNGRRIERIPGGWMILNAEEHKAMVTAEILREQNRLRVQKHRVLKRVSDTPPTSNAPVMPSETETETYSDSNSEKDTEENSVSTERQTPIQARRRKDAAWEGPRVYVPQRLHSDFLALRQGAEGELLAWYAIVSQEWSEGPRQHEEPDADMFRFWRARYAEHWPATGTAKQLPKWLQDAKAARKAAGLS